MISLKLKQRIFDYCLQEVTQKLAAIDATLASIAASRNNETKSTAGDKYETGRAMLQLETDKAMQQQLQTWQLKNALLNCPLTESHEVRRGSLVATQQGILFLCIGLGRIRLEDGLEVICLSPESPIGQQLMQKKVGETAHVNGNPFRIEGIC